MPGERLHAQRWYFLAMLSLSAWDRDFVQLSNDFVLDSWWIMHGVDGAYQGGYNLLLVVASPQMVSEFGVA